MKITINAIFFFIISGPIYVQTILKTYVCLPIPFRKNLYHIESSRLACIVL